MATYIFRRFLLMIPTFLGITILVFVILQWVPGGPMEQELMRLRSSMMTSGEVGGGAGLSSGQLEISEKAVTQLKAFYGLNHSIPVRYLMWLGVWPKQIHIEKIKIPKGVSEWNVTLQTGDRVQLRKQNNIFNINDSRWKVDLLPSTTEQTEIKVYQTAFSGILTGNLGKSYTYSEPVWQLIKERLHISAYFGGISFFLSYLVCIPLGIVKAVKHNSRFDFWSSVLIFIGYSIPGWILGAVLLVYFGGGSFWNLFPLGEFRSEYFDYMTVSEKIVDQLHHTILPVIAYMVSSFAILTVLMKNSLIENLSQDYIRTAFAKGLSERRVIFVHAVRNSLIPIATGIGGILGIWLAGSYLIEKVFNIDGIGLLSYQAVIKRDYPIVLGFLVISTIIRLCGNLLSDCCYAFIDPRIRFK